MKRFLSIFILLVMVLLPACGDSADKPKRIDFSDGSYMLNWYDENGKTTRMEIHQRNGWLSTNEYEYDQDGNLTVNRYLDEEDHETRRLQYYYENGTKVAEEEYKDNVLSRKSYYEGDSKVVEEEYKDNVISKKKEYGPNEKLLYMEQYDENGKLTTWEQLVEADGKEAWFTCDQNDIIKSVRIHTGTTISYTFNFDDEGSVTNIMEYIFPDTREITDPNEKLKLLDLLEPFAE